MKFSLPFVFISISSCLIVGATIINNFHSLHFCIGNGCSPVILSNVELQNLARSISVKIMADDDLGSGILISKKGATYQVLTNAHVLRWAKEPYRVEAVDGQTYLAIPVKSSKFIGYDLAILEFRSDIKVYPVATLGKNPKTGEEVLAGGFPHPFSVEPLTESETFSKTSIKAQKKVSVFNFTYGKVSVVLPKPLEDGYQIGYTNEIEKGMSGGPLINRQGQLIGVNGMHADPLWETQTKFQDGSYVGKDLQPKIDKNSWAIPIQTVLKLNPELFKKTSK